MLRRGAPRNMAPVVTGQQCSMLDVNQPGQRLPAAAHLRLVACMQLARLDLNRCNRHLPRHRPGRRLLGGSSRAGLLHPAAATLRLLRRRRLLRSLQQQLGAARGRAPQQLVA